MTLSPLTENDAEGFRDDAHGLLPTLNELAAARPPGRHRARPELRVRINFAGLWSPQQYSSSPTHHGRFDHIALVVSSGGTMRALGGVARTTLIVTSCDGIVEPAVGRRGRSTPATGVLLDFVSSPDSRCNCVVMFVQAAA
ncbi:unnamed protein product [Chrysodeixis includens]|uniref:Uncharacterized protein n=1 Tax=Chrysodeixis includens TaxID=689277 RepID=A0A9N8PZ40_CHRIL|nr:unnamed protein product [Chrysodeixis includens]